MRLFELQLIKTPIHLIEAREDTIAARQGDDLLRVYHRKDAHHFHTKFNNALDLVKFISIHTVPEYIQWVVNQYVKTNYEQFNLGDLQEIKNDLVRYNELKKAAGDLVSKDINRYTNIAALRAAVNKHQGSALHKNNLMAQYYQVMEQQVKSGNGKWKHHSTNLSIYTPLCWNGCKALREIAPNEISLCVTYLKDSHYFDQYEDAGIMDFVLTPSQLYLLFFSHDLSKKKSEFADRHNNHSGKEILELIKQHPDIKQLVSHDISPDDLRSQLWFKSFKDAKEYEDFCVTAIKKDISNLEHIPPTAYNNERIQDVVIKIISSGDKKHISGMPSKIFEIPRITQVSSNVLANTLDRQPDLLWAFPPAIRRTPKVVQAIITSFAKLLNFSVSANSSSGWGGSLQYLPPEVFNNKHVQELTTTFIEHHLSSNISILSKFPENIVWSPNVQSLIDKALKPTAADLKIVEVDAGDFGDEDIGMEIMHDIWGALPMNKDGSRPTKYTMHNVIITSEEFSEPDGDEIMFYPEFVSMHGKVRDIMILLASTASFRQPPDDLRQEVLTAVRNH